VHEVGEVIGFFVSLAIKLLWPKTPSAEIGVVKKKMALVSLRGCYKKVLL